jgi:hypothetical protein
MQSELPVLRAPSEPECRTSRAWSTALNVDRTQFGS